MTSLRIKNTRPQKCGGATMPSRKKVERAFKLRVPHWCHDALETMQAHD
jgi:predicted HicB family RNase H-like nuclease